MIVKSPVLDGLLTLEGEGKCNQKRTAETGGDFLGRHLPGEWLHFPASSSGFDVVRNLGRMKSFAKLIIAALAVTICVALGSGLAGWLEIPKMLAPLLLLPAAFVFARFDRAVRLRPRHVNAVKSLLCLPIAVRHHRNEIAHV